ncbi:MAG: DUF1848 domain-containing protein [Lachnospiraceae bacterium]
MIVNVGGRTDIVNYYTPWLINRMNEGYVYSRNPLFPKNVSRIDLAPDKVDCMMFCSKNYRPILQHMGMINQQYRIICHYTITAYGRDVEPNVPSIDESVKTLIELSKIVGKEKVIWRYDPLLLTQKYTADTLIHTYDFIAGKINQYISRAIFSFVEMYKRLEYKMPEIIPFTKDDKIYLAKEIGKISKKYGIYVQTCGTDVNYEEYGVHQSGCTTREILQNATHAKFKNVGEAHMRKGCHCIPSRDIGAYNTCLNDCKYCYANKKAISSRENYQLHDPNSPILIGHLQDDDVVKQADQKSFLLKE